MKGTVKDSCKKKHKLDKKGKIGNQQKKVYHKIFSACISSMVCKGLGGVDLDPDADLDPTL